MSQRIILGIDPGIATIGFAFLKLDETARELLDYGVIVTDPGLEFGERLHILHQDLRNLIQLHQPTESCVEQLFFAKNTKTALDVAHGRGVILACLAEHGLRPRSLTPNEIKLAVTGDGSADKLQVQEMIKREFQLPCIPEPDDAADAIGVALSSSLIHLPFRASGVW